MNVLMVVADDYAIRESMRAALPESDLLLFEPDVDEALRRLIAIKADLVLMDDAPGIGQEGITRMRAAHPDMPIVALSKRGDGEALGSLKLAGARACVTKPFACEELRSVVYSALRRPAAAASQMPVVQQPSTGREMIGQHQSALRWLSRTSSYIDDPVRLSQSLVDSTMDIFGVSRSAVLLESNGAVRVAASYGIPENVTSPLRLSFSSGLMRWFEENACVCERDSEFVDGAVTKEMLLLGARLAAPILCNGRVRGAVLIGDKAAGEPYLPEERELLILVGRCASIAIEKASLYQEVASQQDRFNTILSNINTGVVMIRPDKTISMMNMSAERLLQVRASEMIGRSVQRLGSGFADVVLRALNEGRPKLRQEVHDPAIDATLGLSATPLGSEGVVVIFSRIPEKRLATDEVAYSPFWEYLASRVAQEIKNPMVAINTFAQLLPKKYDSEDFRTSFSEVVQSEVGRINSVVETLFDFAQHPRLTLERANVADTVKGVLASFEDELAARAIKLKTELNEEQMEVDIDPVHFSQAVRNVVQNSIDAMPSGGELSVRTEQQEDRCAVRVSDTGAGVSEQDSSLIFMPFFSTKEKGMGLGLTVANRIMKQHNGEVSLVANGDHGCIFELALPQSEADHANHTGS